jgi:PA14 domain
MGLFSTATRSLVLIPLLAVITGHAADYAPGLIGEYFKLNKTPSDFPAIAADTKPYLARIDKTINFDEVEGDFYKSKVDQNFYVRWTGVIKIKEAGKYIFQTDSDDGSRLAINGNVVVSNGGSHGMQIKSGEIDLTAGDHPILVEYYQGAGGAGCKVSWKPPQGDEQPIPESAFGYVKKDFSSIVWDAEGWKKYRGPGSGGSSDAWYYKMDTGRILSASITSAWPEDNIAIKGIAIKLGKEKQAGVCFDTDLLRYSAGWTNSWLSIRGVAYDGAHGVSGPKITGVQLFGTNKAPGWSKGANLADPRSEPFGPLPTDWAKYKGLYLHGDQVVLSYTVGGSAVLELPGVESDNSISRTFNLSTFNAASTMVVADMPDTTGSVVDGIARMTSAGTSLAAILIDAPSGVNLKVEGSRVLMSVTAGTKGVFKLVLANGDGAAAAKAAAKPIDPSTLTKGGPALWTKTIETKGVLGNNEGAYTVDNITIPEDNPYFSKLRLGGVDFFSDGRAAVSTWNGDVWICSGIDDKLENLVWKRFAAGLYQTLGVKIVNDEIYTLGRDQITRLHDLNGDGEADFFESFNNDMHVSPSFHEFALDLDTDGEGSFIFAKGGPVRPGGRGWETISQHAGTVMRVSKDGSKLEIIGTGVRAPNGCGYGGPDHLVIVGDNQGPWTPVCRVTAIPPHKIPMFFGVLDLAHLATAPTDYTRPIYWTPQNIDNSNGGQVWSPKGDKWGPLSERLMHISYGQSNLSLVMMEKIPEAANNCGWQGGFVKLPLSFSTGIMRGRFNPKDGQLYVAGLKGWLTNGAKDGALHRVRYTGKPFNSVMAMSVKRNGIALTFATKLDAAEAGNKDNYRAERWNYNWTSEYGSPEFKPSTDNKEKGHDKVEVTKATVSADGKSVFLEMSTQVVMQMMIKFRLATAEGEPLAQEIYSTINYVPEQSGP